MANKPRKPIEDIIEELRSWLPNYDHGPKDYPILLFRILASMPGGDELEDMGYETFNLGWHEIDQLGRVLEAIQDKRDVEDLVHGLTYEEEEDLNEARRRPRPQEAHAPRTRETPQAHAPAHRPAWPTVAAPRKKAPRRKKAPAKKKTRTRRRR